MRRWLLMGLIGLLTATTSLPAQAYNTGFQVMTLPAQTTYRYVPQMAYPPMAMAMAPQSPQAILQRVIAANGLQNLAVKQVRVVPSNELNAETDGQSILITSKLWNSLQTNDQRAFVISHELAHIASNHVPQTQMRRVGLLLLNQYVLAPNLPSRNWDTAGQVGLGLLDKRFSRNVEYSADDMGLRMMTRAGYNPVGAVQTLSILDRANPGTTPGFLRDHPLDKDRIARLAEKYHLSLR